MGQKCAREILVKMIDYKTLNASLKKIAQRIKNGMKLKTAVSTGIG